MIISANTIKMRFSEFADVDDQKIEFIIAETKTSDNDGWLNDDRWIAQMYLIAHLLKVDISMSESGAGGARIKSESIGRMSITYESAQPASSEFVKEMNSTSYGQRYLALVRQNFPAIMVV